MGLAVARTETEGLFETLAEKSPVGVYIVQDGKFCYANPAFQSCVGYPENELAGMDSLEFVFPEDREMVKQNTTKMLKGELASAYQFRVIHKTGSIRWVMGSVSSIQYRGRRATLGNYMDITERKEAEEALQVEKNKLRSLIDALEYSLTVQDTEYNIIYQNELSKTASGGDHLGEKCYRAYEGREKVCDRCPVKEAFKDGKSHTAERRTVISGEVAFWENTANPIRDAGGKIVACLELTRDVTKRKELETKLRESEQRYRLLFESSPDCIAQIDEEGRYLAVNPAMSQSLGIPLQELVGKTLFEVMPQEVAQRRLEMVRKALHEGQIQIFEDEREGKHFHNTYVPMEIPGPQKAVQVIARDVTERKRREQEFRESEARFRTVVELAPYGISLIAKDGKYEYVNPKFTKILGYSLQDIPNGKEWFRQAYPDPQYRHSVISTWLEDLKKYGVGETRPRTFTVTCKDRAERMIQFRPVSLADGRQLISYVDITDQERLQDELRKSEAKFIDLYENASDIIFTTDVQGRFTSANRATLAATGYSREEILGLAISDVVSTDSAGFWLDKLQKAMGLKSALAQEQPWEVEVVTKDGRKMLVEIRARLTWEGEHVVGVQAIARDITERKKMEEALRDSEEKLRRMFESVSDGMAVIDLGGISTEVNQRMVEMHGFDSKDELRGKSAFELVAPRDRERIAASMKKAIKQEAVKGVEYTLVRADGSEFPGELTTSVLRDGSGNAVGHITITRDISERKKMQEQLMLTDRLASIGLLVSGIAHELNNPLTGVIGFSDLLLKRDLPADVKDDLEAVNREARRTSNIVKGLLAFARQQGTEKALVDVNSIVGEVLLLRSYDQRVNNVEVDARFATGLPQVLGNRAQLHQVFINIIINAEQAMLEARGKGRLTIATEQVGDMVRASIVDDGPGISPENMKRLFTPFFTTKEVGKGTGLGLSICHGIVTEHGGKVYAESEPGKGATFVVELSISEQSGQRCV